jgi:peptidoglycan hydrolase-like protein with peptidoglycan-binding domain
MYDSYHKAGSHHRFGAISRIRKQLRIDFYILIVSSIFLMPSCAFFKQLSDSIKADRKYVSASSHDTDPDSNSRRASGKAPEKGAYGERRQFSSTALRMDEVQLLLWDVGYNPGAVDGIWGPKTARAIRSFQKDHTLPVTGKPDEATCLKLMAIAEKPAITQVSPSDVGISNTHAVARHETVPPKGSDAKTEVTPTKPTSSPQSPTTEESGACSALKTGGTTVRTVGETLDGVGKQWEGSFIGGQMRLAGGIYKAIGTTIEGGADDMQAGKEVSFVEANRRAANATAGAIKEWADDSKGSDVQMQIARAQQVLKDLGYYVGAVDGVMGPGTRKAIRDYQRATGLTESGELESDTVKSLGL